jgi:hypothetical protein
VIYFSAYGRTSSEDRSSQTKNSVSKEDTETFNLQIEVFDDPECSEINGEGGRDLCDKTSWQAVTWGCDQLLRGGGSCSVRSTNVGRVEAETVLQLFRERNRSYLLTKASP